jgi:probable rRNA maturation factor
MLKKVGYEDFDLGILLTTNATIQRYNRDFRGKDVATDVLSFPFHTDLKPVDPDLPGDKIKIEGPDDRALGDIVISLERAQTDMTSQARSGTKDLGKCEKSSPLFREHVRMLLAHGIAHCLGHDHKTDAQYAAMRRLEAQLL